MSAFIAASRPTDWNFPLFIHVLGAMILVGAGPLIALIHEDGNEHGRCREVFATIGEPLGTV